MCLLCLGKAVYFFKLLYLDLFYLQHTRLMSLQTTNSFITALANNLVIIRKILFHYRKNFDLLK